MKKALLFTATALMLFACSKEDEITGRPDYGNSNKEKAVFYATTEGVAIPQKGTKVYSDEELKVLWNENDCISLFNNVNVNDKYMFDGEDGDNGGGFSFEEEGTEPSVPTDLDHIYAVYPYSSSTEASVDNSQVTIAVDLPADQAYKEHSFGIGANTMVAVTDNNFLGFKNVCGYLKFSFYGNSAMVSSVTLEGKNGEKIAGKAYITPSVNSVPTIAMDEEATTSITINSTEPVTLGNSSTEATDFIFVIPPTTFANGFKITVTAPSGSIVEKTSSKSLTITRNKMESMKAIFIEFPPDEHEYVDLGLPSGIKWATTNVGAEKPEDAGDFFAWAETNSKSEFSWATYKYCNGTETSITKYCISTTNGTVDNKICLDSEDDVAHKTWRGYWRMPTTGDFEELINNCTWTWTTRNNVKGYLVTGPNNNSIFLPITGYMKESTHGGATNTGLYWSSSLDSISTHGRRLSFNASARNFARCGRYYGLPVRPVFGAFVAVSDITLSKTSATLKTGETVTLTATVNPSNASDKNVIWTTSDTTVATVSRGVVTAIKVGTATITALAGDKTAICEISVTENREYVDLGLPSGIKWATSNIGAAKPEDAGYFFAWAETDSKSDFSWATYKYCNGTETSITKYCFSSVNGTVDNKISLDAEDDVAHKNWGDKWRMPTKDEYEELINNCTWTWTTQNNVNGYLVTGPNNNSIFLPITGYMKDNTHPAATSAGYYWSSSLDSTSTHGRRLIFNASSHRCAGAGRYFGMAVRPVYGAIQEFVVFYDDIFEAYCIEHFDTNGDGKISFTEAMVPTSIDVSGKGIKSLIGIEHFKNINTLRCDNNQLTNLNVTNNLVLKELHCNNNQLTSLDVRCNTALDTLTCDFNKITSLDVSKNTALVYLDCHKNELTSIDISNNKILKDFRCGSNQIKSLDVSNNTELVYFGCGENQLKTLDVSKNTMLQRLGCSTNQITTLDVSKNTALTYLHCENTQIISLDVSKNTLLETLDAWPQAGTLYRLWKKAGQSITYRYATENIIDPADYGTEIIEVD